MEENLDHVHNLSEQVLLDYKEGLGRFTQKMPEIAAAFNGFTEACFKEGVLNQKQKQLIALGISLFLKTNIVLFTILKGVLIKGVVMKKFLKPLGSQRLSEAARP